MNIRHISQPNTSGCGLACIAMVLNATYQEVEDFTIKENIFKPDTEFWGTTFQNLYDILTKHDIKIQRKRKFKKWCNIPVKVAIVSTNYEQSGLFHWVVYVRDRDGFYIYDPAKHRKKIRDLRGKMSGYYIEILSN